MSDLSLRPYNAGQVRAADALLRAMGGFAVGLRLPAPAVAGVDAEQLGLSSPQFQDLLLSPVLLRKVRSELAEGETPRCELLLSASAVAAAVSAQQVSSADVLFQQATGVVMNGVLFLIEAIASTQWLGRACVYRVLLRESVPLVTTEIVN